MPDDATPGAPPIARGPARPAQLLRDRPRPAFADRPVARLVGVFLAILLAGAVLLALPISSATGTWTDPLTAIFTSTSALTGTGLTVVDTATWWSFTGEVVILVLFVIGGVGVMASTVLLLVMLARRTDLRSRLLLGDGSGAPAGDARGIVVGTARLSTAITLAGALVLTTMFLLHGGLDPATAAWWGLFHAASAFNNAGFDLTGSSFQPYATDLPMLLVVGVLMLAGSVGLLAMLEPWRTRRWDAISVETRLVIAGSALLVIGGAVALGLLEWSNPATLGAFDVPGKVVNAVFTSITARSSGLSTIPVADLRTESQGFTMVLMFIGGAVGSTTGGVRVNVIAVLVVVIVSVLRRRAEPAAMGRRLEPRTVHLALTVLGVGVAVLAVSVLVMQLLVGPSAASERSQIGFEVVSAVGTVGLSNGLTATLDGAGQVAMILFMLLGRLSVLALAILFAGRMRTRGGRPPRGIMRVA